MTGVLTSDAAVQGYLTLMMANPNDITITGRVYCRVPTEDYEANYAEDYKAFYSDDVDTYIMFGETSYGTGGRNFAKNPLTHEECEPFLTAYDIERFHIDYPREETDEI